jgi:hypothetical protein
MARQTPGSRRGEKAIRAFQEAAFYDALPRLSSTDGEYDTRQAAFHRRQAEGLLQPTEAVRIGAGSETVTWEHKDDELFTGAHARIVETLEHPNSVSAGASDARVSAALAADVLEAAIDAAQSAQASNSLEKMLCHQMAAAHFGAMRLLEQSANPDLRLQPGAVARLTNAAARLMDVYQAGCLTLLKLQTRGTQRVLVQHQQVNVGPGGQAIVAAEIPGSRTRGSQKNER